MTTTRLGGAVLAIGLLLTACGSGGNGEADKTASQILADAVSALKSAKSFHLTGAGSDATGAKTTFDITFVTGSGGGVKGRVTTGGVTAQVVVIGGKYYIQGRDFFAKFGGEQAATVVGDRWVIIPASAAGQGFASFSDVNALATCLSLDHGTLAKGGTATVAGQSAAVLVDKGDKPGTSPGKLFVATSGTAYPLEFQQTGEASTGTPPGGAACGSATGSSSSGGAGTGSFTFSDYNAAASVTPPPNPLDLTSLGG
jgi:hypothetical protein